jgi:site-specific recombinase XerD
MLIMDSKLKTLFYLKKPKNYIKGPLPVYLRISLDYPPKELSTGVSCTLGAWNSKNERIKGSDIEATKNNGALEKLENKVRDTFRYLTENEPDTIITSALIKDKVLGKTVKAKTLLDVFNEHNQQVAALVGRDFASGTLQRYQTSLKHTADFIKHKYKSSDIALNRVDHRFISDYDFYLRSVRKCENNTTVKYLKNFKKIILICLASGYMKSDPFLNYKSKLKKVIREELTEDELNTMASRHFQIERLTLVRDIFLFCCYTGLAYIDIKNLKRSEVLKGIDGEMWIHTARQKTSTPTRIPLLPAALEIITRYKDHSKCESEDRILPVLSNQKMNSYLKEIADLCGITKSLTFHIARHTFATTVTLSNGVPIDTVSKMLGHTSIRTTQIYARTLERKISNDMDSIKKKF